MENGNRIRVLVVDDSPDQRRGMKLALDGPRLEVLEAGSGEACLELLKAGAFAIILIDVRMPGMDGFELAERIRGQERSRTIPIMFITTTQPPESYLRKGYALGAVDFLFVPSIPEIFRARVEVFADVFQRKEMLARQAEELEQKVRERTSEHRLAEDRLRWSEERYRRLFETAKDGILILDAQNGHITDVNPFLANLLGYTQKELIGKELWEIGLFRDIEASREAYRTLRQEGYLRYDDLPLQTKGGIKKEVEFVSNVYKLGSESVVQCNIRDVTERKRTEDALNRTEANLRQAQKTEALGKLSGGIAHDFNNLLTAINGYADLGLAMVDRDGPMHEYFGEILKAGKRASTLTQQLLAFSRKQVLAPKVLDLSSIVTDVLNLLRRLIGANIRLTPQLESQLWRIKADPVQIHQVLLNLAINARDALPDGGEIIIRTQNVNMLDGAVVRNSSLLSSECVMLSVRDTGMGIDSAVMARIFEPFFTTKDFGRGTGMGLATVDGIVRQSGGHITVESSPGLGSTFAIYLQRVEEVEEPIEVLADPRTDRFGGTETILMAEDDVMVRTIARKILEMHGYAVIEAEDGETALRLCAEHGESIHILLTDILMPGMNGRELANRFKEQYPEKPVLYMSGYMDEVVVQMGLLEDGAPFIPKPFSPAHLIEVVRKALDGTPHPSPSLPTS